MTVSQIDCLVLGQSSVGKTSIMTRMVEGVFPKNYDPMIEQSWLVHRIFEENVFIIEFIDTSHLEDLESLLKSLYERANVLLVCFSLVDPQSFEYIMQTIHPLRANAKPTTPIVLVGTKSDLWASEDEAEEHRQKHRAPVCISQIKALAQELGAHSYNVCSAKTGEGIEEVLTSVMRAFKRSQHFENPKHGQSHRTMSTKRKKLENGKCAVM